MNKRKKDTKELKIELRGELKKRGGKHKQAKYRISSNFFFYTLSQWILRVTRKKKGKQKR